MREAIRLFKCTQEERTLKLENLRNAIKDGDDAVSRGEVSTLTSDEDLDVFFEKL